MKSAMLQRIQFSFAVPGTDPPAEFRIFSAGRTETAYGPCLFDEVSAALVMQAFAQHGADLFIDYEHKSLDPTAPPGAGKAAAWFRPEVRDGELWATHVEWTPDADAQLRNREWRYFSPAVLVDSEAGRVVHLINVALTNLPATRQMVPLIASQRHSENYTMSLATLAAILGLGATATEEDIEEAARRLVDEGKAAATLQASLLSLSGAETVDAALGVLAGWKESAAHATELSTRIAALEADREARERETLVASYPRKFSPALKEWAKTQTLAALKGFVTSAPDIPALGPSPIEAGNEDAALVALASKSWAQLTPQEKHRLYMSDRPRYEALKAQAR
jgi:phage I-like protein